MSEQRWVIALDVGGSSVKSSRVSGSHDVEDFLITPVDSGGTGEEILGAFASIIRHHLRGASRPGPEGIAFGFPGPFDYENGVSLIRGLRKYDSLFGLNVGQYLESIDGLRLPVRFRNDAEAAIAGEALYGSGRAVRRLIGVTLGTGMGSSFIEDGKVLHSGAGLPRDALLYHEEFHGVQADDVFSTRGLASRLLHAGLSYRDLETASRSAADGHGPTREIFSAFAADLCSFLNPYIGIFGPGAVLVLGGIAGAFPLFREVFEQRLAVPALEGSLGRKAALLGSADLFFAPRTGEKGVHHGA